MKKKYLPEEGSGLEENVLPLYRQLGPFAVGLDPSKGRPIGGEQKHEQFRVLSCLEVLCHPDENPAWELRPLPGIFQLLLKLCPD